MKYKILLKFKEVYDKPGFQFRKNQKQKLPLKKKNLSNHGKINTKE